MSTGKSLWGKSSSTSNKAERSPSKSVKKSNVKSDSRRNTTSSTKSKTSSTTPETTTSSSSSSSSTTIATTTTSSSSKPVLTPLTITDFDAVNLEMLAARKLAVSEELLQEQINKALDLSQVLPADTMNVLLGALADAKQVTAIVRLYNRLIRDPQYGGFEIDTRCWKKMGHLHDHKQCSDTLSLPDPTSYDVITDTSKKGATPQIIFHRIVKAHRVKQAKTLVQDLVPLAISNAHFVKLAKSNAFEDQKLLASKLTSTFHLQNKILTSALTCLVRDQVVDPSERPKKLPKPDLRQRYPSKDSQSETHGKDTRPQDSRKRQHPSKKSSSFKSKSKPNFSSKSKSNSSSSKSKSKSTKRVRRS